MTSGYIVLPEVASLSIEISNKKRPSFRKSVFNIKSIIFYCRNEINTPAATADPITPEILLDIQYCKR